MPERGCFMMITCPRSGTVLSDGVFFYYSARPTSNTLRAGRAAAVRSDQPQWEAERGDGGKVPGVCAERRGGGNGVYAGLARDGVQEGVPLRDGFRGAASCVVDERGGMQVRLQPMHDCCKCVALHATDSLHRTRIFSGPAKSADAEIASVFRGCASGYDDTECQVPKIAWSGGSKNRLPVANEHVVDATAVDERAARARSDYQVRLLVDKSNLCLRQLHVRWIACQAVRMTAGRCFPFVACCIRANLALVRRWMASCMSW